MSKEREEMSTNGSDGEHRNNHHKQDVNLYEEAVSSSGKEFKLTSFAVENKMTVYVLTGIIFLMGLISYLNIPKEAQPEVVFPMIVISTPYFGVSPSDLETQVTQPIEKELKGISGIKKITSQSLEGYSAITVEFTPDVDIDVALQKVRERVDLAKPDIPKDAEDPIISEINASEFPILNLNISGEYSLVKLKEIAEDMQDKIEQFPEVLEVDLSGGLEREVQVNVDLNKLKYYGLTFTDIINAISAENATIPGGTIDLAHQKYLVRVPGEFDAAETVADIVVKTLPGDRPVYVRDLAEVDFAFKERESYARLDQAPVVTLAVKKRSGSNIIELADKVKGYVNELETGGTLPPTTSIKITGDQSDMIEDMVANLENNIISGLILVIGVLLFFMGIRNATLVGIAVPMSMLLSFVIMSLLGFTMNMIVLFALILALGMLVDNAIVVVENIYRYVAEGYGKIEAAKLATGEVAVPIITSTMTTLFAFFPLAFWPGIVGEFMKYLPITLIITLGSSLFVALVINPTLSARIVRLDGEKGKGLTRVGKIVVGVVVGLIALGIASANLITLGVFVAGILLFWLLNKVLFHPIGVWFRERGFPRMQNAYISTLNWALDHRLVVFFSMVLLFIITIGVFINFNAGVEFFPNIEPRNINVIVESSIGTDLDQSDDIAGILEERVEAIPGYSDVEAMVTTVGSVMEGGFGGGGGGTPHKAQIALTFKKYQERDQTTWETISELREVVGQTLKGAEVKVKSQEMGPPTGKPVNIEIRGEEFDVIKQEAEKVVGIIKSTDSIARKLDGLGTDLDDGRPELTVRIDREKAALFGLNTSMIGSTVRSAINGTEASKYRSGEDEYDITVRLKESQREDLSSLADLVVMKDGRQIPLYSVASPEVTTGYGGINRKDLNRVVTVSADVVEGYNENQVVQELQGLLADYETPPGYTVAFTGQQEDQKETQDFLGLAFGIAILLVFGTMVAQFNSLSIPIIIMFSVLFSTIGVFVGLMVFQIPFGIVMTGVGIISLAGVAVNNAIVLLDFVEMLRRNEGLDRRSALLKAGSLRLRPVLLTTMTTVIGLLPLALGVNFDFISFFTTLDPNFFVGGEQAQWWFSLCIAVMFGLTLATFLTLVVVPVMYSLADSISNWFKKVMVKKDESPEAKDETEKKAVPVDVGRPAPAEV